MKQSHIFISILLSIHFCHAQQNQQLVVRQSDDARVASWCGDTHTMLRFISHTNQPDMVDDSGCTFLVRQAMRGRRKNVATLLMCGANLNKVDLAFNRTPIIWAAYKGHEDVAAELLEYEDQIVDVNKQDVYGKTALMYAAQRGHALLAQKLIMHGADCTIKSNKGNTAADVADQKGHKEIADLLKKWNIFKEQQQQQREKENQEAHEAGYEVVYSADAPHQYVLPLTCHQEHMQSAYYFNLNWFWALTDRSAEALKTLSLIMVGD